MQIIVESILGKKSTVMAVESSDSVGSVKAKILVTSQHDWNLSNCMRLLFARDILVDAHTLGDYNIQDGSNVFVLRKCRDVACSHGKRRIDSIVAPNPPDVRSVLLAHGLSYGAHDDEVAIITAACKRLQHGMQLLLRKHPALCQAARQQHLLAQLLPPRRACAGALLECSDKVEGGRGAHCRSLSRELSQQRGASLDGWRQAVQCRAASWAAAAAGGGGGMV